MSDYITTKEASLFTGLSASKLAKLRHNGQGCQYIRIGNSPTKSKVLYKKSDLKNWLESHTVKTFGGA